MVAVTFQAGIASKFFGVARGTILPRHGLEVADELAGILLSFGKEVTIVGCWIQDMAFGASLAIVVQGSKMRGVREDCERMVLWIRPTCAPLDRDPLVGLSINTVAAET